MTDHSERKHSKYSASGAERWINCPGSVELSEGMPDRKTVYSNEGEQAHELLEDNLNARLQDSNKIFRAPPHFPREMAAHVKATADFIANLHWTIEGSELLVETRITLDFISPEMFGTFDAAIIEDFGLLQVFDFKYGAAHALNPENNLQMIFYAMGLAEKYNWNFSAARLWIIQPRIRGYDGPQFWDITMDGLKFYSHRFRSAIIRAEKSSKEYNEGAWCWFCKAKAKCPIKTSLRLEEGRNLFRKVNL